MRENFCTVMITVVKRFELKFLENIQPECFVAESIFMERLQNFLA